VRLVPGVDRGGRVTRTSTEPVDEVPERVAPPRLRTRRPVDRDGPWAIAGILSAPILWYLVGSSTLLQDGYLDPYFDTGYINNYGELLHRYGLTYYATRIANIFPQRVLSTVFGYEAGYYLWRYILVVAALGSVYVLARRRQGVETAVIVTTFLVICPWFPRAVSWDYIDGAAITFLLLGIFFLLGSRARSVVRWSLAGLFFSLAANCNVFALSIIGAFVAAWIVFGFSDRAVRRRLVALSWLAGAFVLVQLAMAVFMAIAYPDAGFFFARKNFDVAPTLLNAAATHYVPLGTVLRDYPFVWVPALGGLAAVGYAVTVRHSALPRCRLAFIRLVALFVALCGTFYAVMQASHQTVTYFFYYVDYLIPAFVLGAIMVMGELLRVLSATARRALVVVAIVGLAMSFLIQRGGSVGVWGIGGALLIFGIIAVFFVVFHRWLGALPAAISVVAVLTAAPLAFLLAPTTAYTAVAGGNGQSREWAVYRLAHSFQDSVLRALPDDGSVGFWYGEDGELNSIQSMFLFGYSRLFDGGNPMPKTDPALLLNMKQVRYIVLLGRSEREVEAGTQALCSAGQSLRRLAHETDDAGELTISYSVFVREEIGGCV
jgi:hypothetical protein